MSDLEAPQLQETSFLDRPQREAWLVVAAGLLFSLTVAAMLEPAARDSLRQSLGNVPLSWTDPQLREYASAWSDDDCKRRLAVLRHVVAMRSDGAVTAAAAEELALLAGEPVDRINYALLAAAAVPAGSDRLFVYYHYASRELVKVGRATEAEELLQQGLSRATDHQAQTSLLSGLLHVVQDTRGLNAMLDTYRRYERERPEIAHDDRAQETLATRLDQGGRAVDAGPIWVYLARFGTNPHVRQRAQARLSQRHP